MNRLIWIGICTACTEPTVGDTSERPEDSPVPDSAWTDSGDSGSDDGALDFDLSTLRGAAESRGRIVGTAINQWAQAADPDYLSLLVAEFGGITPENATKWGSLQPDSTQWDFSAVDDMVMLAIEHDLRIKGHTLVWHSQLPSWVTEDMTASDLRSAMSSHFDTTLNHLAESVPDWDVLNEAFESDGSMRESLFWSILGTDYVAEVFELAAEFAPEARLFYNDYGIEGVNAKSDAVVAMVADLRARGVPIHGVGMQMHLVRGSEPTRDDLMTNMERLGALGIDVHISEMDVRIRDLQGPESERLLAQAMTYYEVVSACVETTSCGQLSFWGFTDRYSWIDEWYGEDDPLLYDDDLDPKPARAAVEAALLGEPMAGCEDSRLENGDFEAGTEGWTTWGSTLTVVESPVYSGTSASLSTDRSEAWQGPVQSVLDRIGDGLRYEGRAWVRLVEAETAELKMTLHWTDDAGDHYRPFAWVSATADDWIALSGIVDFDVGDTSGELTAASLYIEGPDAGVDFYVDDVVLRPVCPETSVPVMH